VARIVLVYASQIEAQGFEIPHTTSHSVHILISGVGAYATQYSLHEYCVRHTPDVIVCAGIAGSFCQSYEIGQVLAVNRDCFADVGVQHEQAFQSIFDMKLANPQQKPFVNAWLPIECTLLPHSLPQVPAITVNTITAHETQRELWLKTYNPVIETMEGAAVHYVALMQNIPCLHVRAISNMVGERNKSKWNVPLALCNLHAELQRIMNN
jgi:futalosine hydrolase